MPIVWVLQKVLTVLVIRLIRLLVLGMTSVYLRFIAELIMHAIADFYK